MAMAPSQPQHPFPPYSELKALIEEHHRRTGSAVAAAMLADWEAALGRFRQIVPVAATPPPPVTPQAPAEEVTKTAAAS